MSVFMPWFNQAYLLKIPPTANVYFMTRPLQGVFWTNQTITSFQFHKSPTQLNKQQMYRVCLWQQTLHTYHLWQQQAEEAYCQVKLSEELIQTLADSGHTCHCYKKNTDTLTFNEGRRKDEISYRRWNSNKHACSIQNACPQIHVKQK